MGTEGRSLIASDAGVIWDGRATLTKPEWLLWAASLENDPVFFAECVSRIVRYANDTPNRVPLSDLYFTDTGRKLAFQARSVVGGLHIRLLEEWVTRRHPLPSS